MAETLNEAVTLSYIGVEKRYSKFGGNRSPVVVTDSELPQESPICDFSHRSPENTDNFYLNVVGIPTSPKRTITNKIDFYNYDEYDVKYKEKWEIDCDGDVSPFFGAIAYEKKFDDDRDNHVSLGGKGHVGVKDQDRKSVLLSNYNIDAMKKDNFYAEILKIGIK